MNRIKTQLASVLSLGLVVLGGVGVGSANAEESGSGHTPVNVCHATSSDTNPYVFITVDDDSVKLKGHLEHRSDPNKTWKNDGVWQGQEVKAGDPKPDLIGDYTDAKGVFHPYDGVIDEASDCGEQKSGKIAIKKVIKGDVAGAGTDFTVRVDCPEIDHVEDVALNEGNGWENTTGGIPLGTECTLTEVKVPEGWNPEGWDPEASEDVLVKTVTVTESTEEVAAVVTNKRRTGKVEITKKIEGDPAGASTEFTVLLDCDGKDYDETAVLNVGNSWTVTYAGIPSGVECTVTEPTVPAGWKLKSISPSGSFVIDSYATTVVEVVNVREVVPVVVPKGVISITKVLDGAATGASTSFTFDVDCPGTDHDQPVVVNVTSGTSATATTKEIPTGVTCTVTERSTPGWKLTSTVPAGGVVAVGSTVTFTNQRLAVGLGIVKAVSPVAGEGVVVEFGDTLTYTLTVNATGDESQSNVVVTDYVPGFDPARPKSGHTTYVAGSAACVGAGTCTVTQPGADGLITWALGDMAAGTSRQVTFQVVIDDVQGTEGETVAVDIINAGAVQSARVPKVPSNEVVTPVTKVLPVKVGQPPAAQPEALPVTGSTVEPFVKTAVALISLGLLLLLATSWRLGDQRHG